MKKFVAPIAVAAAVAAIAGSGIADGASPKLAVKHVYSAKHDVAPLDIVDFTLRCPSGYLITGVGTGQGANDVVYADFQNTKTGAFAFANTSDTDSYGSFASISCVKGQGSLRVHAATASEHNLLIAQAREAMR